MSLKGMAAGVAMMALASVVVATPAAAVVISNGQYSVGISELGQLYDTTSGVGFAAVGGPDILAGGVAREGWGLNSNYADDGFEGVSGVSSSSFSSTANSAQSVTTTDEGFQVAQDFSFAADNILAISTTITNTTAGDLAAIFQRIADFDLDAMPENETYTGYGSAENTILGFEGASPLSPWVFSCNGCSGVGDMGAGFRANLGLLGAGQSITFTFYYGMGADGADALTAQLAALGANNIITGTSGDGSLAAVGGLAFGGGVVPEPATWAMMILGFFGMGSMLRRRRAAVA